MLIYLIPFISAFIGWFTNWIAIKMLFHPKEPKRILGITFHGIFPKRQKQFAKKLGLVVANELLHFDEIIARIRDPKNLSDLTPFIDKHIDEFLHVKLKEKLPVISMFVSDGMIQKIKEGLLEEIEALLPQIIDQFTGKLSGTVDVEKIVTEKVENFSSNKLEDILVSIMSKEFRFVEIIGGVLGFIIGLLQVVLTLIST
ncbi:MAG: DUF445 family protein [Bacteroidetes bacterium]|nr:DUF445 family protein [Bacteroidota bacterium]MBS1739558.1 DUF445 family protein [Bacteroidota bacterium]MBS1776544.1 DUF445 family protein [Bacteroidota bacterium]